MAMVDKKKDDEKGETDQFANELEAMFSGKLKTHKKIEKKWNRGKK